jgi:FeS assembly SUF system protein
MDTLEPAGNEPAQETIESRVIAELRNVYDPEIPVNIYDLGLIYGLKADEATGVVHVRMTLTAPACPVAESLPETVEYVVRQVEGVSDAEVELVWDPPWSQERMSEAARLQLGML